MMKAMVERRRAKRWRLLTSGLRAAAGAGAVSVPSAAMAHLPRFGPIARAWGGAGPRRGARPGAAGRAVAAPPRPPVTNGSAAREVAQFLLGPGHGLVDAL